MLFSEEAGFVSWSLLVFPYQACLQHHPWAMWCLLPNWPEVAITVLWPTQTLLFLPMALPGLLGRGWYLTPLLKTGQTHWLRSPKHLSVSEAWVLVCLLSYLVHPVPCVSHASPASDHPEEDSGVVVVSLALDFNPLALPVSSSEYFPP